MTESWKVCSFLAGNGINLFRRVFQYIYRVLRFPLGLWWATCIQIKHHAMFFHLVCIFSIHFEVFSVRHLLLVSHFPWLPATDLSK